MKKTATEQFLAARRVGTPIIAIRTPDPSRSAQGLVKELATAAKDKESVPCIWWDCITGWQALNKSGEETVKAVFPNPDDAKNNTTNAVECLEAAQRLPRETVLFLANAHSGFDNPNWIQACCNLRNPFKKDRRQVVMLLPTGTLPIELALDVMVIDEPLPDNKQLEKIVQDCFKSAKQTEIPDGVLADAIDALSGLAPFPAEQVTAMSLTKEQAGDKSRITLDIDMLWDRKRQMIENTPGLSVWRGGESFAGIGGCDNVKSFMQRILQGARAPRGIVFIDEINLLAS